MINLFVSSLSFFILLKFISLLITLWQFNIDYEQCIEVLVLSNFDL